MRLPSCVFPISHLLCTSIELSLKAFLRLHGSTEDELMDLGHDLPKLFERAVAFGMLDTGSRRFVLHVAGANYKERLFVYPEQGLMHSIATWRLRGMCHEILVEAFSAIKGPEALASMSTHPGLCIQGEYRDVPPEAVSGWSGIPLGPLGRAALAPTPSTSGEGSPPVGDPPSSPAPGRVPSQEGVP